MDPEHLSSEVVRCGRYGRQPGLRGSRPARGSHRVRRSDPAHSPDPEALHRRSPLDREAVPGDRVRAQRLWPLHDLGAQLPGSHGRHRRHHPQRRSHHPFSAGWRGGRHWLATSLPTAGGRCVHPWSPTRNGSSASAFSPDYHQPGSSRHWQKLATARLSSSFCSVAIWCVVVLSSHSAAKNSTTRAGGSAWRGRSASTPFASVEIFGVAMAQWLPSVKPAHDRRQRPSTWHTGQRSHAGGRRPSNR